MPGEVLKYVTTRAEFEAAQEEGEPLPLALVYNDRSTGPSGEYLVFLHTRTPEHGAVWTMYYGPATLVERSNLAVGCEWFNETTVSMEITDDLGNQVDSLEFDPTGDTITLEDVPGIHGVTWRRVDPSECTIEISDEGRTMKASRR